MEGSPKRVLVVEDAPMMRKLVRRHLEGMGLTVDEVSNAREAVEQVKNHRFDLVCLDLMLPSSSGYEVCEYLKSSPEHKAIPILVISVRNLPADRAHAVELGAAAYLVKPFTRATLVKKVRELLTRCSNAVPADPDKP